MKKVRITVSDKVHAVIERMTNPALREREALAIEKQIICPITDKTSEILSIYSSGLGRPYKDESKNQPSKMDLCAILLTGFCKAWKNKDSDPKWQSNEMDELVKICSLYSTQIRKKMNKNVGAFKITKQMLFSAILHRIATTQNLKEFFSKTL